MLILIRRGVAKLKHCRTPCAIDPSLVSRSRTSSTYDGGFNYKIGRVPRVRFFQRYGRSRGGCFTGGIGKFASPIANRSVAARQEPVSRSSPSIGQVIACNLSVNKSATTVKYHLYHVMLPSKRAGRTNHARSSKKRLIRFRL